MKNQNAFNKYLRRQVEKQLSFCDARLKAQAESRSRRAKTAIERCESGETGKQIVEILTNENRTDRR